MAKKSKSNPDNTDESLTVISPVQKPTEALNDIRALNKQISRNITSSSPLAKVPVLNSIVRAFNQAKPLGSLENMIRTSLNNTISTLAELGDQYMKEQQRMEDLQRIYDQAVAEEWTPSKFLEYISEQTGMNYIREVDGNQVDMLQVIAHMQGSVGPEETKAQSKQWLDWLQRHIRITKQYNDTIIQALKVGSNWITPIQQNYFDVSQLKDTVELEQKLMKILGKGAVASGTVQDGLEKYGIAIVKGMDYLTDTLKKIETPGTGNAVKFDEVIRDLQTKLGLLDGKDGVPIFPNDDPKGYITG
jgi:hypothetical protein